MSFNWDMSFSLGDLPSAILKLEQTNVSKFQGDLLVYAIKEWKMISLHLQRNTEVQKGGKH